MRLPSVLLAFLLVSSPAMAARQAFPPTAPGRIELKTLPAGVLLKASGRGNYFSSANDLFRPLFRYISRHEIAMTTPVEAQIDDAAMYFWVAESERTKVAGNESGVEVIEIPQRHVASAGGRGAYSRKNFEDLRTRLLAWLAERPEVESAGEPYAVYWHGPFTPWFAKTFEVHVAVRPRT
ncbi:MAG: hypothetical protein C0518_06345 [Opitutus sp.]|nr:hypothetical protein [Opitutus sp.]